MKKEHIYKTARFLSPDEVAELIKVSVKTLAKWRCTSEKDLPYIKNGRVVLYEYEDVVEWLRASKVRPLEVYNEFYN